MVVEFVDMFLSNWQATDVSFLEKCHKEHSRHAHYVEPKQRVPRFGIRHYAGLVWYQVMESGHLPCSYAHTAWYR